MHGFLPNVQTTHHDLNCIVRKRRIRPSGPWRNEAHIQPRCVAILHFSRGSLDSQSDVLRRKTASDQIIASWLVKMAPIPVCKITWPARQQVAFNACWSQFEFLRRQLDEFAGCMSSIPANIPRIGSSNSSTISLLYASRI